MSKQVWQAALAVGVLAVTGSAAAQDTVGTIPVEEESAPAEAGSAGLPYTFVAGRFLHTDYDDTDVGQNGLGIEGSFLLTQSVYLVGSYFTAETDEFDHAFFGPGTTVEQTQLDIGVGYRHALSSTLDLNANLRGVQYEVEIGGESDDETGYQAGVGARALVTPALEARGEITYIEVSDANETYLNLTGLYTFVPGVAAGLDVVLGDDSKSYGLTFRYGF